MARAVPTPTRPAALAASLTGAHAHLIERITQNKPAALNPWYIADADDFTERAEHLRRVFLAVEDYVLAAVNDIAASSNAVVDKKYLLGCLADLTGEIVGSLENTADDLRMAA